MSYATQSSIDVVRKNLPYSKMEYPEEVFDYCKYLFWRMYTPLHPYVRDIALSLGVVSHQGRQNFFIGTIAAHETTQSVVNHLVARGYGNHFIAWKDEGEVVSLRRTVGFKYQYHLRIFEDGEIRGHYEYTPEYRPILHWKAVGQENRDEEFLKVLEGKIVSQSKKYSNNSLA